MLTRFSARFLAGIEEPFTLCILVYQMAPLYCSSHTGGTLPEITKEGLAARLILIGVFFQCQCVFCFRPVMVSSKQKHLNMFADKPKEEGDEQTKEEGEEEVAADDGDRVLQCMKWGLVLSWHKDDPSSFGTMLNNCRLDGITEKPSFRGALSKGQRCVVVVHG